MKREIAKRISIISVVVLIVCFFINDNYASGKEPEDVIIFNNQKASRKKADMPPARFSHKSHSKKLKCKDCHPSVFKEKKGENLVTMKKNVEGEYCGKCHNGRTSWDMSTCKKCHV